MAVNDTMRLLVAMFLLLQGVTGQVAYAPSYAAAVPYPPAEQYSCTCVAVPPTGSDPEPAIPPISLCLSDYCGSQGG